MVDPNALVGGGLALLASRDLLTKLLGPTADYMGGEIKGVVEKCNVNIGDIFVKAYHKLGGRVEQPGAVNPRVLKNIIEDGKFCEDELSKEYFAGVLASSRTKDGKDDRGVTNAKLVSNLSSYQIRTHYIFYTLLRRKFLPYGSVIFPGTHRGAMIIYIPSKAYFTAMEPILLGSEYSENINVLAHSMNGLRRNDLIEDKYTYGSPQHFANQRITLELQCFIADEKVLCEYGISFQPTPSGMELYLCVHGFGDLNHFNFLDADLNLNPVGEVRLPNNVELLYRDILKHFEEAKG
ncbi:MAG: hypothetical protein HQ567_35310 [Candidatus Nealsonbacteria bacterium]|nr:hypothetical protein [Candidatus Nealsonbacteria bacterium]